MELKKKRKMLDILRGLIGSGFEGNQEDICRYLNKKGFTVTQSTVSRALKKIGARKVSSENSIKYEITHSDLKPNYQGSLLDLLNKVQTNESQIVLKTKPGSAMFLAGFIDYYCVKDVIGTIAGDDTIFVAPKSTKKIKIHADNVKRFIENFV